ncbi:MAG: HTH domain-containing protein [Patescibacteria group bacterium]|nr:HTH domain-containing protein [Patescibacteria group bacterium]
MEYFLVIFSSVLALAALLLLWQRDKKCATKLPEKIEDKTGICAVSNKRATVKEKRKQKILEFMEGKRKVSNKKLREVLKVTDRTVVRYMDELEKFGQVEQVGKTGMNTYYKLK